MHAFHIFSRFAKFLLAISLLFGSYALADSHAKSGQFSGRSGHVSSGYGELVKTSNGSWEVHLKDNFRVDRAPGPWVALGKGGNYVKGTLLEPLRSRRGMQVYKIPASINAESFDTIVIWCKPFNIPLAVAKLSL